MDKITPEVGDVVQLKSGSPDLTICEIDKKGQIHVNWFNDSGQFGYEIFHPAMLVIVTLK